jgi:hypothetical protein
MKDTVLGAYAGKPHKTRWTAPLLLSLVILGSVIAETGIVYVSPAETTVLLDESFTIDVELDENILNLKGYTLDIVFDSDLLQLDNVTEGPLLPLGGTTYFWWGTRGPDTVQVDAAILINGNSVDGPGIVAHLHFTANALGVSPVGIVNSELRDPDNQSIQHNSTGASVRVTREGNDCDYPYVIGSIPFWDDDTTCNYTNELEADTSCTGHNTYGNDVVYQFTPSVSGGWGFFVSVPFGMWNISLYVLSICDPLECLDGSDNYGPGSGEAIDVDMQADSTYYIIVDGRDSTDCGQYNFGMNFTGIHENLPPIGIGPSKLRVVPSVSNHAMDIRFDIEEPSNVDVRIFDRSGSLIREVLTQPTISGRQSVVWDTRDNLGHLVPKGAYFIQLRTETSISMMTVTVIR